MASRHPIIGLSASHWATADWDGLTSLAQARLNSNYCHAVLLAGGIPVILPTPLEPPPKGGPAFDSLAGGAMGAIQGLILTGGGDVVRPGAGAAGPPKGKASRDAMRDLWEQALLKAAVGQERPIFGICRGIQVMNHYFGGTLYEHIPGELPGALAHQQREPRDVPTHPVELEPGSLVAEISGSASVMVNSGHHQAPRVPAPGFRVSGRAPDSVIEAMEHESLPFALGVQWHPEGLAAKRPEALALFKALVGRASAVRLKARGGRG